jgi:hypothetical protein
MKRGNRRHYRELGKLGAGIAKSFADEAAAKEQRRLAGIASGKARALNAKRKAPATRADLAHLASQIKRLNESANVLS